VARSPRNGARTHLLARPKLIRNTLREDSGTLPSRAGRVTEPKGSKRALSDLQQSVVGPLLAAISLGAGLLARYRRCRGEGTWWSSP